MKQVILVLVLMWAMPSFADYQEGRDAFDRGDYSTAVKEFEILAGQNDPRGQYALAIMYDLGEGVPQSSEEAVKYYRLSAEQGYADAQFNLGLMYHNGEGVPKDDVQAYAWWSIAATQGNANAQKGKGTLKKEMTREQIAEAQKLSSEYWEITSCRSRRTSRCAPSLPP